MTIEARIDDLTPIGTALALAQAEGQDALLVTPSEGISKTHCPLFDPTHSLIVFLPDLEKMASMGLNHLPVDAIATPIEEPTPYHGGSLSLARTGLQGTFDVSHRLTEFFPSFFVAALYEIQSLLKKAELEGYVIGGIARDILLIESRKLTVNDVDITVRGDAIACAEFLKENSKNFELLETYPDFGTAKITYKGKIHFDLASTRKEIYKTCGSLPEVVERGVSLEEDISRRDFTVNTLSLTLHELGKVLDFTGGIQDVEKQRLRILHPASFFEDPSRILRALKFSARLDFKLDGTTRRLVEAFMHYGSAAGYRGGGSRIKEATMALFSLPESPVKQYWMDFYMDSGCYRLCDTAYPVSLDPEPIKTQWRCIAERIGDMEGFFARHPREFGGEFEEDWKETWLIYLAVLFAQLPQEAFQAWSLQLGLTRDEREVLGKYRHLLDGKTFSFNGEWVWDENVSPENIYNFFHSLPTLTAATTVLLAEPFDQALEMFRFYKSKLEPVKVELNGKELMALGVPEGESIGAMRRQLLTARLRGRVKNRLDEMKFVRESLGLPFNSNFDNENGPGSLPQIESFQSPYGELID